MGDGEPGEQAALSTSLTRALICNAVPGLGRTQVATFHLQWILYNPISLLQSIANMFTPRGAEPAELTSPNEDTQ